VFIRTRVLEEASAGGLSERELLQRDLNQNVAPIKSAEFDAVSPIVAQETVRNAFIALLAASVGILLYIWYAFRRVPKAYRYGTCAVIALVHDMLFVLGVFSILGKTMNMEVNSMFIVGLLTVAGYSVHDTIVVFDRIRENVSRHPDRPLAGLVNLSIMETIGRSLNTSLTTLFVLLAMLLLGGPSIRGFLLVLAIGIVIGTYSSIFNASQLLVAWEQGEIGRVFRLGRQAPRAAATALLHLIGR
jgi:preprotein translocase subunit SecF